MLPFLQFLIILAVIITFAKLGGYLSTRLGQPAVAGEVLAGLLLGPTAIDLLHWPIFTGAHLEETLHIMAELGVLLLLFIAGLEIHISDLRSAGRAASFAGVLGFLAPLSLGTLAAAAFGFDLQQALFIGLLLSPTSVSISAQTMMELGVLRSRVGVGLLGAAVIDDMLVVLGISLFLALTGTSAALTAAGFAWLVVRMVLYIAAAGLVGYFVLPRLARWVEELPVSQAELAFAVVVIAVYAWTAEVLGGVAPIIGAFLAGLAISRTTIEEEVLDGVSKLAYGLFVPIFFIGVGLEADLFSLTPGNVLLLAGLFAIAVLSKIVGSGLGGLLARYKLRESLQLGMGMVPRGEVVLIVATVGITEGFIGQAELSVTVALVVLTTVLTPPILRILLRSRNGAE